jgi:uncharacterized protein YndB with AHSA1/START domain
MTVTSVDKDFDNLTLTLIAEFDAPIERVWELWADPRQLERWWGPPGFPATFDQHDLTPGGEARYSMIGPEGQASAGWWRVTAVDPPRSLEFIDGWAGDDGKPNPDAPTTTVVIQLAAVGSGTRMEIRSTFDSREYMERVIEMGLAEGLQASVGQMDALLAA